MDFVVVYLYQIYELRDSVKQGIWEWSTWCIGGYKAGMWLENEAYDKTSIA